MAGQSGRNTSISKHRLGCRLPCESPPVGEEYMRPGPVVSYKLSPEELAKYGPVNYTTDRVITAKSIEWAVKKAETLQEAAGLLKISQEQFLEKANEAGIEIPEDWWDGEEMAKIQLTKEQIERAIANTTNVNKAAKELGVGMSTLYKYMNQYGIKAKNPRSGKEDVNMDNNSDIITATEQVDQQIEAAQIDTQEQEKDYTKLASWLELDKSQEPLACATLYETETAQERGTYEVFGQNIGRLVDEKQRAYGHAFQKIGQVSKILYPNGVSVEKLDDFTLVVRVLDKLCRIADGNKEAFGESPWRDIAGYGLLGYVEFE